MVTKFTIKIKKNEEWEKKYNTQVELYKNDSEFSWLSDKTKLEEYILGKNIGSVGQSYFQGDGKNKVIEWLKNNRDKITGIINSSGNITDRIDSYKKLQDGVLNAGGRNCWMAVHAMVAALQADFLCNILSEPHLDKLYALLEDLAQSEIISDTSPKDEPDTIKLILSNNADEETSAWNKLCDEWEKAQKYEKENISWYYKSAAIYQYFRVCCGEKMTCDLPWQVLMALTGDVRIKILAKQLENQKNLILTGAPGTGKTYMAKQIAATMIDTNLKEIQNSRQYAFVQFHPSYDYTDFVEGLRPMQNGNNVVFNRKDGIFKDFCVKAAVAEKEDNEKVSKKELKEEDKRKFVFVIDEINRGEISKIFGELFFSIDPGYRGEFDENFIDNKVKTQYQNLIDEDVNLTKEKYPFKNGFYVPNNIYIIGTMNDIDRSVESMDFAFRRRFAFVEITAADSESMLNDMNNSEILINKMESLNEAIIDPAKGGLSPQYQIGASYFRKMKDLRANSYKRLWEEYLKGVLYEYFRGMPDAEKRLSLLKKAYDDAGNPPKDRKTKEDKSEQEQ